MAETKMTQKAIQNNLDALEKMNGFLNTLIEKTNHDNVSLKLGDQLRPTEDYNGTLFEVVREPYWCYITEQGRAIEMDYREHDEAMGDSGEGKDAAERYMKELEARKVDPDGWEPGVIDVCLKVTKDRVYEDVSPGYDFLDDENEKQDENGNYYIEVPFYSVVWRERILPPGYTPQRRVWLRKICIISKAEGHTDDKNLRALPFPLKQFCFENLIQKEIQKLTKISRTLEGTPAGRKKTAKVTMRTRNQEKYNALKKIWMDDNIRLRIVKGFFSEKYGMFLKSDKKYEVTATLVNPLSKLVEDVSEIKSQVEGDGKNLQAKV